MTWPRRFTSPNKLGNYKNRRVPCPRKAPGWSSSAAACCPTRRPGAGSWRRWPSWPSGSRWSSCAFIAGLLRPEIIAELELERFGLELYQGDALSFSLFPDGTHLMMWKEMDKTIREIEGLSKADSRAYLDFGLRLQRFAGNTMTFRSPLTEINEATTLRTERTPWIVIAVHHRFATARAGDDQRWRFRLFRHVIQPS